MGLALDFLNFDAMRRNNSRVYLVHEIVDGCVGNAHEVIAKNKQDAIDSIDRRCKQKPDEWYAEDITEMAMDYKNNVLTSLDGLVSELKKLKLAACNRHGRDCFSCMFASYKDDDYDESSGCRILDLLYRIE